MSLNARPSGAQKRKAKNIRLAESKKLRGYSKILLKQINLNGFLQTNIILY
jgi:hypothetical protein